MCLLTFISPETMPNEEYLINGAIINNDGHGWAIVAGDTIIQGHSMDATEAIDAFMTARALNLDGPALFHSRFTTHGVTTVANTHPFRVRRRGKLMGSIILAHNGILPADSQPATGDWRSDTRILAEDVFMSRFQHLDSAKTRQRLERWLGSGNRLVVLTTDSRYRENSYIFNEDHGTWVDGCWYSNDGYLPHGSRWSALGSTSWLSDAVWSDRESDGFNQRYRRNSDGVFVPVESAVRVPTCEVCGARNSIWQYMCTQCMHCQVCVLHTEDCNCRWDHASGSLILSESTAKYFRDGEYLAVESGDDAP